MSGAYYYYYYLFVSYFVLRSSVNVQLNTNFKHPVFGRSSGV